jgi:glycosyltransferase involved in cell wall biosynthesis
MTNKPRVVIVCDWFDPAFRAGGPVRSLVNLILHLHPFYDFDIICGNCDYGSHEPLKVETAVWTDWKGKARVMYLDNKTLSRSRIFSFLDEQISGDTILYVQGIFSLYFSIYPILWWHRSKHRKLVVAPRGMLHRSARSVKPVKKMIFINLARLMGWFNHINWHSTQPDETAEIRRVMGKKADIFEAPNIPEPVLPYRDKAIKDDGVLKIISVGRISDEKNPLALLRALSMLLGPAEVTIIGDYSDKQYFENFRSAMSQLPSHVNITHILSVAPDQMPDYYGNHQVFVSCSRGENFGHAIAEALSAGLPCFIGENTPWKGLKNRHAGAELPLDPAAFTEALERYRQLSSDEKAEMSRAAHNFAVQSFHPEMYVKQYDVLFSMEEPDDE